MALIKKPNELEINPYIKALIYGQAGTGKTTLALSAPKPLLFDFDGGIHRVHPSHRVDTVQIKSYQDFIDVLGEDLSSYQTLVIDTGGKMLDYMADYIVKNNPKMGRPNGMLTLQGYGERKAMFTNLIKKVGIMKKHIVFVAHRETRTEGDDTRYVPLFGGSNYDSLVTELDLVGYIEMNGTERTITFNPTSRNDGKNTCNLPAVMKLPVIVDADGNQTAPNQFLTKQVIEAYENRLKQSGEEQEKYDEVMEEIRGEINLITDAPMANDFVKRIDAFDHIGNSKAVAGKLLKNKADELGLKFDKETKKYSHKDVAEPAEV
ncbi:AAA domain-containing protein [Cruoricaptor ignavus]|uniref:AAA domain-containing protein n=1 Tax=Cruoricaptor ignavus TaxID=1118202 RepID=A0A1M6HH26_9FLAO|nr:ATP-binding protein [Cruoricaptor ignavus]SHJ21429.1 AAA domain-containing protein [Cruoricaptor ignavus]